MQVTSPKFAIFLHGRNDYLGQEGSRASYERFDYESRIRATGVCLADLPPGRAIPAREILRGHRGGALGARVTERLRAIVLGSTSSRTTSDLVWMLAFVVVSLLTTD